MWISSRLCRCGLTTEGSRLEVAVEKEIEMTQKILEPLKPEEFDALIEAYVGRPEPDTLSLEAFD